MNWAAVTWLVLLAVFLWAEASTVALISLWFAAGALAALLASLTGGSVPFQVFLFLAVSIAAILALRPLVRKYITPNLTRTNVDSVIGTTGYVTGDIDNAAAQGQVKLGGMFWTARSTSGEPVAAGTLVRVDRIEGVKAYVSPVEVPAQV